MIFNKFLLGLPPTKVNIDSELFSLGLTREMLTREMIKFCIHYIFARLYYEASGSFFLTYSHTPNLEILSHLKIVLSINYQVNEGRQPTT